MAKRGALYGHNKNVWFATVLLNEAKLATTFDESATRCPNMLWVVSRAMLREVCHVILWVVSLAMLRVVCHVMLWVVALAMLRVVCHAMLWVV